MFHGAATTVSSRGSSGRSDPSRRPRHPRANSSLPSLLTSLPPFAPPLPSPTSFDATNFVFREQKVTRRHQHHFGHGAVFLKRFGSYESQVGGVDLVTEGGGSLSPTTSTTGGEGVEGEGLEARDFLETYSLPRVARVGSDGPPLLLYRCFDSFARVVARGLHLRKGGREAAVDDDALLYFPEGYSGWFSLLNEKNERAAARYASFLELVREQVCSFISMQPFTAYSMQATGSTDNQGRMQYLKTQVRGGQVFQLRAVFQHKEHSREGRRNSTRSSRGSRLARDKDLANRYAHLISQSNQEYYVPLTTKGEFYEVHSSMKARLCFPGLVHRTGPLALDKECLYRLAHLLRRVALPARVKLLAGPLPHGLPKDFTDTFILERKYQEPLLVTCTLPPPSSSSSTASSASTPALRHEIGCVNLNTNLRISRCTLGFDSESRLFKSQRIQAALAFCQNNVESWYREVKIAPNLHREAPPARTVTVTVTAPGDQRPHQDHGDDHGYSTPDLGDEPTTDGKQIITKKVQEKFPKPTKWYRHLSIFGRSDHASTDSYDLQQQPDNSEKCKSIDRYKDMSRFIEQKLSRNYNPVKKSASFMFSSKLANLEETPKTEGGQALLKCHSLDMELNSYATESRDDLGGAQLKMAHSQSSSLDLERGHKKVKHTMRTEPDLVTVRVQEHATEKSFITERLCSRFHVKTKMSSRAKPAPAALNVRAPAAKHLGHEVRHGDGGGVKSVSVQVYREQDGKGSGPTVDTVAAAAAAPAAAPGVPLDDIPYSQVADEVVGRGGGGEREENIYAEICEREGGAVVCDKKGGRECERTTGTGTGTGRGVGKVRGVGDAEYHYVKLGSNGDSVTQSDSDEAIYSTLR